MPLGRVSTFWKKSRSPTVYVLAEVPSIAKVVIALDQFHLLSFGQGQFVGASGFEVVYQAFGLVYLLSRLESRA